MTVAEKVTAIKEHFRKEGFDTDYQKDFSTNNHCFRFTVGEAIRIFEVSDNFVDDRDLPEIIEQFKRLRIIDRIVAGPDNYMLTNDGLVTKKKKEK
jgi:hypothetical protein